MVQMKVMCQKCIASSCQRILHEPLWCQLTILMRQQELLNSTTVYLNCWQLLKLCSWLWWSIMPSYLSSQFKFMIFHLFTCILYPLRVYYELIESSVVRTLHWYRRDYRFVFRSGPNFILIFLSCFNFKTV